jgi:hypothetical protein
MPKLGCMVKSTYLVAVSIRQRHPLKFSTRKERTQLGAALPEV